MTKLLFLYIDDLYIDVDDGLGLDADDMTYRHTCISAVSASSSSLVVRRSSRAYRAIAIARARAHAEALLKSYFRLGLSQYNWLVLVYRSNMDIDTGTAFNFKLNFNQYFTIV
eukprot:scaffold49047_cov264-Isochrysis_galbana.AAC.1